MLQRVKAFLKSRPQLYDLAKRLYRWGSFRTDPIYDFFDGFSKSHDRRVNFIQIGANDGLRSDPIRELIVRDFWQGVLIEPLPNVFSLLQHNYRHISPKRLTFVNAAITDGGDQNLTFWTYRSSFLKSLPLELRLDLLRKSSFSREHLERTLPKEYRGEEVFHAIQVPCLTLGEVIQQHWCAEPIDLIVIDAEGHEASIIPNIDFESIHPEVIFFESHNLREQKESIFELLRSHQYELTEIEGNAAAVRCD